jgi:AraC-like DNA-binding protein
MPEIADHPLLDTGSVQVRDVCCQGHRLERSEEECTSATNIVFPYRGVFVRHLGRDQAVAEANQVLFFNAGEGYRVSHPVRGGDDCVNLVIDEPLLREIAPRGLLRTGAHAMFQPHRLRIDARAQALVALLRHRLRRRLAEPLEAESLALTLARRAFGVRTAHRPGANAVKQRLTDRVKLVLASHPARRWTLAQIAAEVGHSPVYLTQVFQQVEGLPLYRYHLRLRLTRALQRLADCDDLTSLSLDLGFYSHSHFSTAFANAFGYAPSTFQRKLRS